MDRTRRGPPKGPRVIDRPRAGKVRVIDERGEQLGIVDVVQALTMAEEAELDLVEIAPTADPPTCKLMDFGKYKFEKKKKTRGQKKTVQRRKEVKLRPKCESHDFDVKVNRARAFLGKGHKVLVTLMFRGREAVHLDIGRDVLVRFAEALEDCSKVEKPPAREGRNRMGMILVAK